MSATFKMDLFNLKRVQAAMKEYNVDLEYAVHDALDEFAERYQMKLFENAAKYGIPTSIIEDFDYSVEGFQLSITIGGDEILYFEYGTGIVGQGSPHPHPTEPWEYDVNGHGTDGWIYLPTESYHYSYADRIFMGKSGDVIAHTTGMESKPFLYDTWLWGRQSICNIVNKHLNRMNKTYG